tara:strand:- start:1596 stop:2501 length:906 start_codon:yes stop_codon:yes gene_type:complete
MIKFSFIIPIFNERKNIKNCLESISSSHFKNFEVIIIDDFSTDGSYSYIKNLYSKIKNIKIYKNIKKGKVNAINYGVNKITGDIVKIVDGDDRIDELFFLDNIDIKRDEARIDKTYININDKIVKFSPPKNLINKKSSEVFKNYISIPRHMWTFHRSLLKYIFPMPELLPYEDVWICFHLKKFAKEIMVNPNINYHYIQHGNQVYGGILNFNEELNRFRAERNISLINYFLNNKTLLDLNKKDLLINKKYYNLFKFDNIFNKDFFELIKDMKFTLIMKYILLTRFTKIYRYLTILKWKLFH